MPQLPPFALVVAQVELGLDDDAILHEGLVFLVDGGLHLLHVDVLEPVLGGVSPLLVSARRWQHPEPEVDQGRVDRRHCQAGVLAVEQYRAETGLPLEPFIDLKQPRLDHAELLTVTLKLVLHFLR